MPATLTPSQLYGALTQQQVEAVQSYWPTQGGAHNPVGEEISAALARVDAYTSGWEPAAVLLTAWARDIAVWHLLKRLNLATEDHAAAKDTALKELESLREGKYPGIARTNNPVSGIVSHGSRDKVI